MTEQNVSLVEGATINAFVASRGRSGGRGHASNRGRNQRAYNNHNNNTQNNQGNGEGMTFCGDRIICHICGKRGHPALDCYQRMNAAFEGRIPAKSLLAMTSSPITFNKQQNGSWLLVTDANVHITPDIQNLAHPKEYNRNDGVGGVGNNFGISIAYFGSNHLQTNACSFALCDILHCPSASTNIISAHKFTLGN